MAKVLLVEDDNNLREIYEARLQAEGYDIASAHDGEEALVMAKQARPDLIISDVMMPKISGFEMLDILRNTDGLKDVKVIMLTALGQSEDQQRADRLGADRYLVKSQVTLEDIVTVTSQLLASDAQSTQQNTSASPITAAPPTPAPAAITAPPVSVSAPSPNTIPSPAVAAVTPTANNSAPVIPVTAAPVDGTSTASNTTNATTAGAISANDEAASVETQIENFVKGASSVPTPPPNESERAPTAVAPAPRPTVIPAAEVRPQPVAAAPPVPTVLAPAPEHLPETIAPSPVVLTPRPAAIPPAGGEAPDDGNDPDRHAPSIAHKKIIAPISLMEESKPDINSLLAAEIAKDNASGQVIAPGVIASPAPLSGHSLITPEAPPAEQPFDPNTISL